MPPEFLFFDLGRVLLDFCHDRMVRQMAAVAGVPENTLRQALMPSGELRPGDSQWQLEEGTLAEDVFYEQLADALGCRPPRADLELAASDIFTPIAPSLALLSRLHRAGNRLGLLSNTSPIHWRFFMDGRFPVLNEAFEIALGSFHLKAMKPAPPIYQGAAALTGVAPERIFFADDRADNVAGAIACGWDAIVFTDPLQLTAELRLRGVAGA
ncbi:HAD family hydrolase [Botrimarina hoheduenensis]|uniref:Alpha-D-glucose-1-phosphate phosphatase YihX n=1 Tax=Botrimarina hoheduenensis TaxID=2528000 RepID=A0A5C5VQ62_9BACT|nr:HAD family phosphatase [Botrimarina hoheduenensis]TWT40778.1 Alpha-D-glucose-1-phosphate phosphatase YihX [Botrimarina hoheduenensis]